MNNYKWKEDLSLLSIFSTKVFMCSPNYNNISLVKFIEAKECNYSFSDKYVIFMFVLDGTMTVAFNENDRRVFLGECIIAPFGSLLGRIRIKKKSEVYIIIFCREFILNNVVHDAGIKVISYLIEKEVISVKISENQTHFKNIIRIVKYYNFKTEHPFYNQIVLNLFYLLMYELQIQNLNPSQKILSRKHSSGFYLAFLRTLEEFHKEERSISFYANKLNVSTGHITRKLRTITRKSTKTLIEEYVIFEIKSELKNKNFTLSQIADDFHFSSLAAFSKFFKKSTGISPSEYRSKYKF
ncbi:helix-turn-helix domain-containing protein [Moheibacter lacus]|uniref:AraC family transcriptional regulator n=1 Tax=Moheibacter lacus TaxID=2745851 RepID=A0A838ZTL8_9FLAO|nr:helix-turn-helix domain-containing protein [Moheibacter lacus]MBA5630345.1 AraC family transcriptional regulator [Moheibacter lacus]